MESLIITIDGPAGSGKSAVAQQLAKRLDVAFLDTGAMYRGVAVLCLEAQLDMSLPEAPAAAEQLARQAALHFDWSASPPRLWGDGRDLTDRLRDSDVAGCVSPLAAMGPVRAVLVEAQRRIGQEHPRLVTEGRDQGSVVFTNAQVKFYLDASPRIRAARRAKQIRQTGRQVDEEQIYQDLLERDHRDSNRADGPLVCPDDAIVVDTSDLTLEQVIDRLEQDVRQKNS